MFADVSFSEIKSATHQKLLHVNFILIRKFSKCNHHFTFHRASYSNSICSIIAHLWLHNPTILHSCFNFNFNLSIFNFQLCFCIFAPFYTPAQLVITLTFASIIHPNFATRKRSLGGAKF